ncbi:MAG: peptidoglycan-binding domain-containing protein [Actinomycetota bacterium]
MAPGWVVATTVIPVAPSGYVVLKKGDTGIKVKALQIKLIRVGFSVVTSSSTFDSATETALKTFQTNNALESNGTLDWVTNVVLNKAAANSRKIVAKLNDNNDTVKTINANLKLLSFTPDEGSLFGPNTQKAVMAFQLKYKIGVTGMMDGRTNRKLISEVKIVTKEAEDVSKGIKADSKKSLILRYQDYLNKLGYTITADGVYGDTTIAAVKDFQGKNKNLISGQTLTVNGIINTETQKVINAQIKELKKQMRADLAVLREEVNSDEALQKIIIEWEEKNPGYRLAVTPNGDIVVTKD